MIYISNKNKVDYFISKYPNKNDDNSIIDFTNLPEKSIGKYAFKCLENFEYFYCKNIETIESEAFKDCSELKEVIFVEKDEKKASGRKNSEPLALKGIKLPTSDNFNIQNNAFENCENLTTIILPKFEKLIIEKNAFKNCTSLRTVVAIGGNDVIFTQNPFEDCPEELTFICEKNSAVEKVARENSYRYINV